MKRRDLIKLSAMGLLAVPGITLAARVPVVPRLQLELRPEQRRWLSSGGAPVALWGSNLDLLRLRQHQPV